MKMNNPLRDEPRVSGHIFDDVAQFNDVAGPPSDMVGAFLHMVEEQGEVASAFRKAVADRNNREAFEAVVDGCIDSIYVTIQLLYAMGLSPLEIHYAWREVHASNMEKMPFCKACAGTGEIDDKEFDVEECLACRDTGLLAPPRDASGKILKPANWRPPNFRRVAPAGWAKPKNEG